jgi:hypothetical protein
LIPDQCTSFENFEPITMPGGGNPADLLPATGNLQELLSKFQLTSSDIYYYADCEGADNIPGVETASNSQSTSDASNSISTGKYTNI